MVTGSKGEPAGYLSLSVTQVEAERLGIPGLSERYPIAAVRLAHEVMERAAIQVLLVDALNLDVVAFYARWGFRPFLDDWSKLFLTAAQIRASIQVAQHSD